MVQILRDQMRQYTADKAGAIRTGNLAAAMGDVSQVAGAVSQVAGAIGKIRAEQSADDVDKANNIASIAESRIADWNAKQIEAGANTKSPAFEKKFREEADRIYKEEFTNRGAGIEWSEAKDTYRKRGEKFTSEGVAANIRHGTQQQTARRATKAKQDADMDMQNYIQIARDYGRQGNTTAMEGMTKDATERILKKMEPAIVGNEQKMEVAAAINQKLYEAHNEELYLSGPRGQEIVTGRFTSNEQFLAGAPAGYKDNLLEVMRNRKEAELQQDVDFVKNKLAAARPGSADHDQLSKDLELSQKLLETFQAGKDADAETRAFLNKNKKTAWVKENRARIEGLLDFDDKVITREREAMAQSMPLQIQRTATERMQAQKLAAYQSQSNSMSEFARYWNPQAKEAVAWLAGKDENMTPIDPATGMAISDAQMSFIRGEKPKSFWQGILDDMTTYEDQMSRVSPLTESSPQDKAQVNYELGKLLTMKATDEYGNPADFQAAALTFLSRMAATPLTESERRDYQDMVGQFMVANDSDLQNVRDLLMSGDVGIYQKGKQERGASQPGTHYEATGEEPMNFAKPETFAKVSIFSDLRMGIFRRGEIVDSGGFDDMLRRTQADYQTKAVGMIRNGATRDEVMNRKRQMFAESINKWYGQRYVIDLAEMDRKIQNKEPAFQELDGVIYEYKGRDSVGRPMWKDNSILNTNRDFSRINKSYRITDSGLGNGRN